MRDYIFLPDWLHGFLTLLHTLIVELMTLMDTLIEEGEMTMDSPNVPGSQKVVGDEACTDDHVTGGKADLDAILLHQGNGHVPQLGNRDRSQKQVEKEKENMYAGNDEELLDMIAEMPLHSQQHAVDDDIDALLDLEEDVFMEDQLEKEELGKPRERPTLAAAVKELPQGAGVEKEHRRHTERRTQDAYGRCQGGIIKDRNMIFPQKDALHATDRYMVVTAACGGQRVYAPMQPVEEQEESCLAQSLRRCKGTLLSTKIEDLVAAVEKDHFERTLRETKVTKKKKKVSKIAQEAKVAPGNPSIHRLWVDKYAPQGFMDLLSDELINRDVVKWMKGWDHCVFGSTDGPSVDVDSVDPYKRPEHKIILLAGPPGLGKTTLAHIVARHCGYKAMEINASDERNGPALMSKVVNAMEMASVLGEKRPNCIIIDEIDGASGGIEGRSAISALVKLAKAKPTVQKRSHHDHDHDAGDDVVKRREGKKHVEKPLTRPIICICNDLYAPVLRPLRDVAKVFVVRPPGAEKLVERLRIISKTEKLKTDNSTLRGLVERTECDIRSCLNTMQFIAKRQNSMKMSDISSVGAGQKDVTIGVFRLWKDLLHHRKGPSIIGREVETESQRCLRQYNTLADFADQDLVLGGIFESLPSIILFDMALMRTSTVLENMLAADIIQTRISRTSDFSLMPYLPAYTLRVGNILSGPENPSVNWPRKLLGIRREMYEKITMLHKWRIGMGADSYTNIGKTSAVVDIIPHVPWIMTPNLRPVSRHLYSNEEKLCMERLVDSMIRLGLSYSLEESDSPVEAVEFSPPIHTFWDFSHASFLAAEHLIRPREITIPIRQMIVHEIDMERIKRNAKSHGEKQSASPVTKKPPAKAVPISLAERLEENKVLSKQSIGTKSTRKRNWLEEMKDKEASRNNNCSHGVIGGGKKHRAEDMAVLYKFHEGYTNAVKKPVKISQL